MGLELTSKPEARAVSGPSEDGPTRFVAATGGHPFPQVRPHFHAKPQVTQTAGTELRHLAREGMVDGLPCPVFARRHDVGVHAKPEAGVGVSEVFRDGADARPGFELNAGVEVTEGVHAVLAGGRDASDPKCGLPDVRVVVVPVDQLGFPAGEQEALDGRVSPVFWGCPGCC